MDRRALLQVMGAAAVVPFAGGAELVAQSVDKETVYELRVYHAAEGKLEPLLARFRGPERAIFERNGMHCVAFWTATDDPLKGHTLIYMLRHKSRAIADENWKHFRDDPEWVKLKAETEANGALVEKHESTFMSLTDFSAVL
ncbi:NIPSNAP family protein [Edaphobacter bradus]|uniref:NIPSNAP family protein n=1 Tax=Edaphobacter bradus TaxID=2259016 RepID=UPI0021E0D705|nr:NIPSNAP family protein [Edaphobacter bradus]